MKKIITLILIAILPIMNFNPVQAQKKSIKVAMAQIFCLDGDRSGNFARIEGALEEAVEQGAELVCYPETAILGWVNPVAHDRAYPIPGKDTELLCGLAKKYAVHVCIGLAEKDGEKLYDSVILIDDKGRILLKHRKINTLDELMDPPYTAGESVSTVGTRFGEIGLLICADSFKKELLEDMAKLKPDLMIIPYGWAAQEESWPQHSEQLVNTVKNAAKIIGCPVVGTDLIGQISNGPWTGLTYGGSSVAIDENGKILARGKDRDRDVVVFDLYVLK